MEIRNSLSLILLLHWIPVFLISCQEDEDPVVRTTRSRIHYEAELRKKLFGTESKFEQYDRKVRPSGNATDTVTVSISMRLLHIEGVEEHRQVLKIHTWMGFRWNDQRLKWDSTDYANITVLHMADEELWRPDISLYNNAEGKDIYNYGSTTIMIQSNGDVVWVPPASFSAQCNMTFDDWPNDKHRCHLVIGSWTQNGWDLDLQLGDASAGIDRRNYVENDQWQLLEVSANRIKQFYPCCVEPYISLTFSVHIRRNPAHYVYTLVYPANILLLSSWFLFLLPDFRFRLIAGLLEILALCGESVFLWTVVPPTYGTPPVVRLITYSIVCVFYALILCLLLDKIGSLECNIPDWIRTGVNPKLGALFGVVSSKYFKPKRQILPREVGVLDSDKELLAVEYETNDQGIQKAVASDDGDAASGQQPLPGSGYSWRVFSDILSRFCLVHYAVLTIVIIALHL